MNTKVTESITEIYLAHLRAGNIETARSVREELPFWETHEPASTDTIHIPPVKMPDVPLMPHPSIPREKIYCYYRKHMVVSGPNILLSKDDMVEFDGHYFCSEKCKDGYTDGISAMNPKGENPFIFKLNGKWSRKYDACIGCGTTERNHMGKGLCTTCYFKKPKLSTDEFSPKHRVYALTAICANEDCPNRRVPMMKTNMFERNELYFCSKRCRDTDL